MTDITAADLVEIHETLADWFAESDDPVSPPGVRDSGLLLSAAARPYQTVNFKEAYPTIFEKAAALFHSLINNHAFHNGNKRVALVAAQVLLAEENYWLEYASDKEMFDFTRKAAAHELEVDRADELFYIVDWFQANARKVVKGDHPLKYSELRQNLRKFGFDVDPPNSNLLNVYKDGVVVERISKQGMQGFRPYHTDYIAGLRKRLNLTAESGIDSARFYGGKGISNTASQFMELRTEVMRRLAKT